MARRGGNPDPASVTRREFVLATAAGLAAVRPLAARQGALTAAAVAERLRERVGLPWREKTLDGFAAGDPGTVVTGIAVCVLPTLDVLRQAANTGRNMVIAQEPTFYTAGGNPGPRAHDPVYLAKRAFIDERRLVVYRFSDHWHARQPTPAAIALAGVLGWIGGREPQSDVLYRVPETRLSALAAHVRERLAIRGGMRVVGSPDLPVRTVFVSPGTTDVPSVLRQIERAEVVIAGEPREWEVVPYVADTWTAGRGKGLISLGRVVSQGPSAGLAAVWLRTIVSEVPVDVISLADPYWSPGA